MAAEADFGVDRTKTGGRRSYCKACDRRRGRPYYDARKDELYSQRVVAREAAWQAELEAQVEESRKRVAAAKRMHAARSVASRSSCARSAYRSEPGGDHGQSAEVELSRPSSRGTTA